ncbi:hypothetical protein C0J52_14548 [Blattella germanica]|nr:hypothetical protein C0J52_14548 [Blattella germanica]
MERFSWEWSKPCYGESYATDTTIYYRDDDEFLIRFLRPTKFYPESALALMKRAAEFKQNNASVLDNIMPIQEEKVFCENDVVNVLVNRDQKGRRILVTNNGGK